MPQRQWNGDAEKQRLKLLIGRKIIATAELLQERHRQDVGRAYPPASAPGEFPALRTGKLQRCVTVAPKVAEQAAETGVVQVTYDTTLAPYALILKRRGRLAIADTSRRARSELQARFRQTQ